MIELSEISMDYGSFRAVDGCSFTVGKGEIVGLVGPNGAGKTTIMKILSTQLFPSEGSARVNGFDIEKEPLEVRTSLGFLPEQAPVYDDMEVREYLSFVGRARGLGGQGLKKRLGWVAENCGLKDAWCKPIGDLSKGYRQRVGLAQALIHDPPVLILDEPTSGLDPLQIMEIRDLVRSLAPEKAILFSTHILQEITAITHRAVVINQGKIMADGPLEELSAKVFPYQRVAAAFEEDHVPEEQFRAVSGVMEIQRVETANWSGAGSRYRIITRDAKKTMKELSILAREKGLTLLEIYRETPDLEEVFSALIYPDRKDRARAS